MSESKSFLFYDNQRANNLSSFYFDCQEWCFYGVSQLSIALKKRTSRIEIATERKMASSYSSVRFECFKFSISLFAGFYWCLLIENLIIIENSVNCPQPSANSHQSTDDNSSTEIHLMQTKKKTISNNSFIRWIGIRRRKNQLQIVLY